MDLDFRLIDAPETQAYRDFAEGGHVQSDAIQETLMTDALAKAQLDKADEEAGRALFGDCEGGDGRVFRLMRKIENGDGEMLRGVWKGAFKAGEGEVDVEGEGMGREERSLLD